MKTIKTALLFAFIFSFALLFGQPVDSSRIVRVLTFNIYHGETMNHDFNLDLLADVIKKANPDLVGLQEVDFKTNRAKKMDLVTELGYRTKMASLFGKAMDYDGGAYGEGVLTKNPILASQNHPLSFTPGKWKEPRAALEVLYTLPSGDTIFFVGTHLDHTRDSTDRIIQAGELNAIFSQRPYPGILAGDLNATPESEPMNILRQYWTPSHKEEPAPTIPCVEPRKKIDYILFTPAKRWRVLHREVINAPMASDHCPYLVVLELLPEEE